MGFLEFVDKALGRQTTPKQIPASAAMVMQERGRVAKANVQLFRHWAEHSEWVRAAVNIRRNQVSSAAWDIVPFDPEKTYSTKLQQQLKGLFDQPNPAADSFRSWVEPIIEDVLVLDAGCVEKVRTLRGEITQLWGVDGGKIRVSALWDGSNPKEARYYWYPDGVLRAQFTNDDMLYIMSNPSTYRPVGLSPIETLKLTIDSELAGHSYNSRQVTNAAPDGMLNLGEGVRPEAVEEFKSYWSSEVAGRGAMAFIGGSKNPTFIPFRPNNRDMQFTEWQIYLVRKICAVFGLSPQDLGLTFDVNRASGEIQQENTDDRGIRPLMALLQDYLTREIVWDESFGGLANNLAFRFTSLNLRETLAQAKVMEVQLAGVPWRSVNEIRKVQGLEPWGPEFDNPMVVAPTGAVRLDDVPSAREVMEQKKPAPPPPGNGPPPPAKSTDPSVTELLALMAAKAETPPPTLTIEDGAFRIDVSNPPVTNNFEPARQEAPVVNVEPPQVNVAAPEVTLEAPVVNVDAPIVNVDTGPFTAALAEIREALTALKVVPEPPVLRREVVRDANGRITEVIDHRGE